MTASASTQRLFDKIWAPLDDVVMGGVSVRSVKASVAIPTENDLTQTIDKQKTETDCPGPARPFVRKQ